MHDLIREHARALAGRLDPDRDRDQATARLLDYYQHAAARADALIARQTRPGPAAAPAPIPAAVPGLAGQEQALAWARAERASLLACLDHATAHRPARPGHRADRRAWPGCCAQRRPVGRGHHPPRRRARGRTAPRRPARPGQRPPDLGNVRRLTGDYPAAARRPGAGAGHLP